jgi:hypothetical protein
MFKTPMMRCEEGRDYDGPYYTVGDACIFCGSRIAEIFKTSRRWLQLVAYEQEPRPHKGCSKPRKVFLCRRQDWPGCYTSSRYYHYYAIGDNPDGSPRAYDDIGCAFTNEGDRLLTDMFHLNPGQVIALWVVAKGRGK